MSITMYQADRNFVSPANDASLYAGLNGDHNGVLNRGNKFAITASGLTANINTGQAIVQGRLVEILTPESLVIPANGTGSICLVVDLTKSNDVSGSAGNADYAVMVEQVYVSAVTGTLTQDDLNNGGYIYELPLATYVSTATSVSIVQNNPTFVTSGVLPWTPNTNYLVGDLVTFNTLGTTTTGLLTNPIFRCSESHTSASTFPDSTNTQWELVNATAYHYEKTITPAGVISMILKRDGKTVQIVTASGTTGNLLSYSNQWVNLSGTVPSGFTPSSNIDVPASIGQIQNMWNWRFNADNSIQLRQNWGSNTTLGKGNYFAMTGVWTTQDVPVWVAGTPT